jgi:oxalate decarboxylase/phosphoglucose isomerase-like protein (cupin superfamily)
MKLPESPLREVITIDATNIELEVKDDPAENLGALKAKELFHNLNIIDPKYKPSNYNKADGTPLRLFDSQMVNIDASKRSKEDMGFWHRNIDSNEVIICVRGALRWETEMGAVILKEGEVIVIPKRISHRSMLCEESLAKNVLIELKYRDKLNYTGHNK